MTKKDSNNSLKENSDDTTASYEANPIHDEIQEIDYDLVSSGPLYFDPRHIKPGYVPCFVSDLPGNIEMYKRWGYNVVIDEFKVGSTLASTTSQFGSAVTVQSKCGQLLVLMAIKKELHDKLMKHRERKNAERTSALMSGKIEGVDERYQSLNGAPIGEYKILRH